MTPETQTWLNAPCPHGCGRSNGKHLVPFNRDDCHWTADAISATYTQAENRFWSGMWTYPQWEAFQRLHTLTAHRYTDTASSDVARYVALVTERTTARG